MSDLIKREDVQREIQTSFDGGAFRWQDGQDLMDRINALPTASPWHRVEDRLPDKNGRYLVFDREIGVMSALYIKQRKTSEWTDEVEEWCDFPVTHWMPLPEPPKEDA